MVGRMIVAGLTGPTGAGKSEVARALQAHGVARVDADELSREVTRPGSDCLRDLAAAFSPAVLRADGSLDRGELARRAFADEKSVEMLNAITHPYILALSRRILNELADGGAQAAVLDAPLLFESGTDAICDLTVAVLAPAAERLARIMKRDSLDEAAARRRMDAQPPDGYYRERATILLDGEGPLETLRQSAAALAGRLLQRPCEWGVSE